MAHVCNHTEAGGSPIQGQPQKLSKALFPKQQQEQQQKAGCG